MSTEIAGPAASTQPGPGGSRPSRFGLPTAIALVVGSVIGTGVFGLPAALAPFGPVSLVAFVLVTIGALALAVTFGALSKRIPGSGGPYAYARDAFGEFAGFLNAWCYWITAWAGNAAIVVALVGYAEVFVNTEHNVGWSIVIALAGLWIPALVNLSGLRNMAVTQILSTVLKIIPLLFMATIGLFFVKSANFGAFNASGTSIGGAISAAAAIALFSYIGIETASVAAGRVRDPERNVGRATVLGTIGCAVVYVLGTLTVFGTVPNSSLRDTKAPFTDAANAIFGGEWAGQTVAIAAVVSGLGCLIGWTLIVGEMPMAAAKDELFPRAFLRTRGDIPSFGIISSTVLASALVVVSYTSFEQVFTTLVLLSVFTAVVPYLFSAAAQLFWLLVRGRRAEWPHLVRDGGVSVLALAFAFWALAGSGYQAVYYGSVCLLLGVPLYIWLKAGRGEYGEVKA
ncbi:amino acid permease [Lentzea flava]|uniref:Transporter n=1 Tax=Lentzea flava TaxID=103732 RepID=A0ABQ2URU2_9PSEU|nr:amino acid permease [Lentzea flava]MCP2197227.1 basic amino acid/polyamine antiporter, APA family [Lentzea flava]GGU50580.1 transporter [Lentzea flava]